MLWCRALQRSIAGVIVLFTADETLLIVMAWVLAGLAILGSLILSPPVAVLGRRGRNVWSLFQQLRRLGSRSAWEVLLPVRVVIPNLKNGSRSQPLDSERRSLETDLRSWQSDGR